MNDTNQEDFPRHSKGKRPQFYENENFDELMSMILVLASEFCGMRDRLDTFERVAAEEGTSFAEKIENFEPDPETVVTRNERRNAFLKKLYYLTLKRAEEQKANDSKEQYEQVVAETSGD